MKIGTETEYIEIGTAVPQLGQECRSLAVFRRASTAWKRLSVATEFAFLRDLSLAAAWKFIIGRPPLIAVLRATARLRNPLAHGNFLCAQSKNLRKAWVPVRDSCASKHSDIKSI